MQGSTTETDKLKEIEELEKEYNKLQDDLNEFKWELDSIQDDIIDQTLEDLENDVEAGNNMDSEIIPSENDKPNWRERNKKTVLIWAGTLWVWLLIRHWWKKRKEKEWGTTWSSSSEKPWYKKWRGVWLIGVWGFLWIKWLINHFKNEQIRLIKQKNSINHTWILLKKIQKITGNMNNYDELLIIL